jgi:acetylornithine deacetylase/succinyl-diaminopimelate desuccinylase-like protein
MLVNDFRTETAHLLADLIRIDTTNPPGNETPAAEHLAAYLAEAGVQSELRGRTPERANLVARLRGSGDGPALMLLSCWPMRQSGRCRRSPASSATGTYGGGERST